MRFARTSNKTLENLPWQCESKLPANAPGEVLRDYRPGCCYYCVLVRPWFLLKACPTPLLVSLYASRETLINSLHGAAGYPDPTIRFGDCKDEYPVQRGFLVGVRVCEHKRGQVIKDLENLTL